MRQAMGGLKAPLPVQVVIGIIASRAEDLSAIRKAVADTWGPCDLESPVWPFTFTDYYTREMGADLVRQFVALRDLAEVEGLHRMKLASNDLEARLAAASSSGAARPVNVDPGYVCHSKLVLFSTKDFSHRIYVGDGIYAESTLEWRGREYITHPWTFPDYRTAEYRNFFAEVRVRYVDKLKSGSG
jgi:hypothetical protein